MAVSRKAMTEGIRTPICLCALIDIVLQSLSQKSKIFASSLYTREPGCYRTGGFFNGSRKHQGMPSQCALASDDMRIWPWAGADRRNTRQNWKRFSEVTKIDGGGLLKKRKIISCVKKGLIS